MTWILNNAPALILSVVAIIVSILSWNKTRVFYDLDMYEVIEFNNQLKTIKKKLNTGKYTILSTCEETHGRRNRVFVLLGKIKK